MKKLNTINKIRSATKLFTLGLAASAALMAGSAQAATYANWTFNDGTGADSSGNGHDLGGQNGPVIASPAGWGPSPNCTSHGPGAREGFESFPDLSGAGFPTDNFTLGGYFNPAHALDGGIPVLFHIVRAWPTASDVRRYDWTKYEPVKPLDCHAS